MKQSCTDLWEAIVTLAEGGDDSTAEAHVLGCADCRTKLEQLRQTLAMGRLGFFEAPATLVNAAKAIMPTAPRRVASLLRSTLAWSGSRAVSEDFQLIVNADEEQIRLMYMRAGDGWQVLTRLPSRDWSASVDGSPITVDQEGGLSFAAGELSETAFELEGPSGRLAVPSAEELLRGSLDSR